MNIYFKKELPQNAIMDSKGRRIPFEVLNDSIGVAVFSLDDGDEFVYIESLRELAKKRKGGVMELTEQEFIDLKKKSNSSQFSKPPKPSAIRVLKPVSPYQPRPNAEAVVEEDTAEAAEEAKGADTETQPEPEKVQKTSEPEATSSIVTEEEPWNDADEGPRTAKVKDHGDPADISSTEAKASD